MFPLENSDLSCIGLNKFALLLRTTKIIHLYLLSYKLPLISFTMTDNFTETQRIPAFTQLLKTKPD